MFDLKMLGFNLGLNCDEIKVLWECKMIDVMQIFAKIYGEYSAKYGDYKWQKLTTAADYFDYKWQGQAHGALADTLATKYVYRQIMTDDRMQAVANEIMVRNNKFYLDWYKQHVNLQAEHEREALEEKKLEEKEYAKQQKIERNQRFLHDNNNAGLKANIVIWIGVILTFIGVMSLQIHYSMVIVVFVGFITLICGIVKLIKAMIAFKKSEKSLK